MPSNFNMCASQFDMIKNEDKTCEIPMRIFLRNSKKDNINTPEFLESLRLESNFIIPKTGSNSHGKNMTWYFVHNSELEP